MATKGYKAVFVKEKTHEKIRQRAFKEGKTFDALLAELVTKK